MDNTIRREMTKNNLNGVTIEQDAVTESLTLIKFDNGPAISQVYWDRALAAIEDEVFTVSYQPISKGYAPVLLQGKVSEYAIMPIAEFKTNLA